MTFLVDWFHCHKHIHTYDKVVSGWIKLTKFLVPETILLCLCFNEHV